MKYFISHRGNIYDSYPEFENNPQYVMKAIEEGFHVLIDVWVIDNKIFLGNDEPKYNIYINFLFNNNLLCCPRNFEALNLLAKYKIINHYLFNNNHGYGLTSRGIILSRNINELSENTVYMFPELNIENTNINIYKNCIGICSNQIYKYKKYIENYDKNTLFETKYGSLFIKSNDCYYIEEFENKYWNEDLLINLLDTYLPYGNILNIGAHIGSSTLLYSRLIPDEYKIYSFEPQSLMYNLLDTNIKINNLSNKCIIHNKALFCYNGEIEMEANDLDGPEKGNILMLESENKNINYGGVCIGKYGEKVECITLDSLELDNISIIHCDSQGSEQYIFNGGKEFIKKNRPFILYQDNEETNKYLTDNINNYYSEYNNFNILNYCLDELNNYCCIKKINNSSYNLLIPYVINNLFNLNYDTIINFDYTCLQIYEIPNTLTRIGSKYDGGYVIAEGFEYDLFLSCGISDNIYFELAFLHRYNVKCVAFDGTIEKFPENDKSIEWVKKNIGYINNSKNTNMKEYMQNYNNIFLKMDIEGYEYNWIDSLTIEELQKFSQIVIEIHIPFDIHRNNILKKLSITHYPVHIHGNNYSKPIENFINTGFFPSVFEVTYIRKDLLDENKIFKVQKQFPTDIDMPNNPYDSDIQFCIPL